ncbi:hypothetical protein A3715_14040 [Oleiphilus sp. HI0009]|nr:hypothetical protein A3715_14040 [Oleiphilus sp. HI0009]
MALTHVNYIGDVDGLVRAIFNDYNHNIIEVETMGDHVKVLNALDKSVSVVRQATVKDSWTVSVDGMYLCLTDTVLDGFKVGEIYKKAKT